MAKSKYVEFDYVGDTDTGKTEIWNVLSIKHGHILGQIKWYGGWRQYCFHSAPHCIFNNECLSFISRKITDLMILRSNSK